MFFLVDNRFLIPDLLNAGRYMPVALYFITCPMLFDIKNGMRFFLQFKAILLSSEQVLVDL